MFYYSRSYEGIGIVSDICPFCNYPSNIRIDLEKYFFMLIFFLNFWGIGDYIGTCGNCHQSFKIPKDYLKSIGINTDAIFNHCGLTNMLYWSIVFFVLLIIGLEGYWRVFSLFALGGFFVIFRLRSRARDEIFSFEPELIIIEENKGIQEYEVIPETKKESKKEKKKSQNNEVINPVSPEFVDIKEPDEKTIMPPEPVKTKITRREYTSSDEIDRILKNAVDEKKEEKKKKNKFLR